MSLRVGALIAVVGVTFTYPLMQLVLRLMGRPTSLPKGHPMNALGMQVAFVLPLMFPVVYGATLYRHSWLYPALMIAVGAHYLPFVFSYGMKQFGVLAAVLIGIGVALVMFVRAPASAGAWVTRWCFWCSHLSAATSHLPKMAKCGSNIWRFGHRLKAVDEAVVVWLLRK